VGVRKQPFCIEFKAWQTPVEQTRRLSRQAIVKQLLQQRDVRLGSVQFIQGCQWPTKHPTNPEMATGGRPVGARAWPEAGGVVSLRRASDKHAVSTARERGELFTAIW